jgi:hypothetical protein
MTSTSSTAMAVIHTQVEASRGSRQRVVSVVPAKAGRRRAALFEESN